MFLRLFILSLIFPCLSLFAQSNLEGNRIAELYELLSDKSNLYGKQVLIYDYKMKGKQTIKDSTLISKISIANNSESAATYQYDTTDHEIVKYKVSGKGKIPTHQFIYDNKWRLTESRVVNNNLEVLSNTFYKYENDRLISEESFTGYAYLDQPRKLSLINYKYKRDKLVEKDKKYSLNGSHWVQTWVTKYNETGNPIWLEETNGNEVTSYVNSFNKNGQLIKSEISSTNQKSSVKEIEYYMNGFPKSVFWYYEKNKRPRQLTKYFLLHPDQ